jgi:hypothetical protein
VGPSLHRATMMQQTTINNFTKKKDGLKPQVQIHTKYSNARKKLHSLL